jgi:hypothetical protein
MMTTSERAGYWNRIIQEWRDSGCSQKEFCQRNEISYSNFIYWRRKEKSSQEILCDEPRAVEVSSTLQHSRSSYIMEFDSSGIVVAVAGANATVTVSGRINLELLERIMAACSPIGNGI